MQNTDNPAWRLYRILERALAGRALDYYRFWATAFDVPWEESRRVFRCFAEFQDLLDEVERLLRSVPGIDHSYHLQNLPRLRGAMSNTRFDGPATDLVAVIEGGLLRDVGFWAEYIERFGFPARLEPETLSDLLADLDALFDGVRSADIADELRAVVLDALEGVRRAIVEYWLHGSAGLQEEIDRAIVRLARYADDLRPHAREPWFSNAWMFLMRASAVVEKGKKMLPLVRPLAHLMGVEIPPLE